MSSSATGAMIGSTIGFTGVRRKLVADQHILNLYYRFAPESQGLGYAKEAAAAAIKSAVAMHPNFRVVAAVNPANAASARLAIGLGMKLEKTDVEIGHDIYLL